MIQTPLKVKAHVDEGGDGAMRREAEISPCGRYRYSLARRWDEGRPPMLFLMLNPSTADAETDDPTIRSCMRFARREGAGALLVGNLFAFRATTPAVLRAAGEDGRGPENDRHLLRLVGETVGQGGRVVLAWGDHAPREAAAECLAMLGALDVRPLCLGRTRGGAPRHPLYLSADKTLEIFA